MSIQATSTMRTDHALRGVTSGGACLHTALASHSLDIAVADSFASRLRGLMLRRLPGPDAGLLLTNCSSVHTAFMLMPIDVLYLDGGGVVTKCVERLRPFGASASGGRDATGRARRSAVHTLELPAGTIARLGIAEGDRLAHPHLEALQAKRAARGRQRGVAIVEMVVVGPILTMLGLTIVQYGMMFFAKNQVNHAAFMAARAGSVGNAKISAVTDAFAQALIPMYGGGETAAELATSLGKAKTEVAAYADIKLLNPTKESFEDWHDSALATKLNTGGKRVIPNSQQAFKPKAVGAKSGQTIQDANLIKLRIVYGYEPKVPIVGSVYTAYLKWLDNKSDPVRTKLINLNRIPMEIDVTAQMQSDAIEETPVSSPGPGNNGNPVNPPTPPVTDPGDPPDCPLGGCTTPPQDPSGPGSGGYCPIPVQTTLSADTTFAFGSSTLSPAGMLALDKFIADAKALNLKFEELDVTGYTDPLGSDALNQSLSQARAQAVSNYLNSKGITAKKVNVVGAGANNLIKTLADCPGNGDAAQKACLEPNRRVEIVLRPEGS